MKQYILKVNKEIIQLNLEANESFEEFQCKVFALTDIPPKNMKILFKAKMIKDNISFATIPDGSQLIIMGTKSGKELKQTGDIKIEQQVQLKNKKSQYGLVNIGNTCYMNAGIQFLKSVPEFYKIVTQKKILNPSTPDQFITNCLSGVLKQVDVKDVIPKMFVSLFLNYNVQFQPFGTQQDSDQFIQKILASVCNSSPENAKVINDAFEIQFIDTFKNKELENQPIKTTYHQSLKLCCSMGGVEKQYKVGTLKQGIKLTLQGTLEKLSEIDNQMHVYQKITRLTNLPKYFLIQMVRFFYKAASDLPNAKAFMTKICKSIDFPAKLDLFEFCNPQLQQKLKEGREAMEQNKKIQEEQYKRQYQFYKESLKETNRPQTRIIAQFKEIWNKKKKAVENGLETGVYNITSVVTHLGHSVESGHYMAWVRQDEETWTKFDDDTVYDQPNEKFFQLRGGQPNLEIAYLLLFQRVLAKPLPK